MIAMVSPLVVAALSSNLGLGTVWPWVVALPLGVSA
jgi:hypothetical protein